LSELHRRAAPLIRRLWAEAADTGMPIARPLWLAAPGDARAAGEDQSWMLGSDVLVAPVVEQGASGREVYFPEGCWESPEDGRRFEGGTAARVDAPLGALPYFFRCGTRPFDPPPSAGPAGVRPGPVCQGSGVLRSVGARPRGRGLDLRFTRRSPGAVTIEVFQASAGRRVSDAWRVARFAGRERGVRWNGRAARGRPPADGLLFVRFTARGTDGRTEVRRVTVQRSHGRFRRRAPFHRAAACDLVPRFKLFGPAFGGREHRALRIAFSVAERASVRIEILRGRRVVRRFRAAQRRPNVTHRLRVGAKGLPRGVYSVRLVADTGTGRRVTARLSARRL
jgi:hypothetical protein